MSDIDELVLPMGKFARMPYETRDDKDVAKMVVAVNGRMLKYVSARLANDTQVVRLAVSQWPGAFAFAGDAVHADKRFVTSLIKDKFPVYCHLRERLSRDLNILKYAVRHEFTTLNMAPEDLKANRNVVRRLVLVDSRCFQFAAPVLREDEHFVLRLMAEPRTNKMVLFCCTSPALKAQLSFIRQAIRIDENIYLELSEFHLRNDRDVVVAAVAQRGSLILKVPPSFLDDPEVVMLAIHASYPFAFRWASYRIRDDPVIALAAVRMWPKLFDCTSESLQMSKTFVWDAACCGHFPHRRWHDDRALLLESVVACPSNLRLLSPPLRQCPTFLRDAMHREPSVFFYANSLHRANPVLARAALALEPKLFSRLAAGLRRDPEFQMLGARTLVRATSALDAVDAEIDTLLGKVQRLADGAASLAHRVPDVTEQAEAITARVHQPHGLVFREVHKRGFEEAFGDA